MHAPAPKPALPAVGIFSDLDASEREALAGELETRALKRGDDLVCQGDPADALYIVLTGRFAVTLEGRREPITEIGPDQPIGEIAFLTGGTRTATVTALRDSLVLRLGRAEFERLSGKCPSIWRTLTCTLSQRLAATTASEPPAHDPRPRTIAIIRAGEAPVPRPFIEALTSVFSAAAKTLVLDGSRVAEILPKGMALDSAEATQAFNELESAYDYVIFIADEDLTPWSQKAVRHADLVLGVGTHPRNNAPVAGFQRAMPEVSPGSRAATPPSGPPVRYQLM
jgi:NTE family protein